MIVYVINNHSYLISKFLSLDCTTCRYPADLHPKNIFFPDYDNHIGSKVRSGKKVITGTRVDLVLTGCTIQSQKL